MDKTFENARKLSFEYHWRLAAGNPLREDHAEQLDEAAIARIFELYPQGYKGGILCELVTVGEEEFEFFGGWEVTEEPNVDTLSAEATEIPE